MCRMTNGNYFYQPLMTLYRKDNQTRYVWCDLVKGTQEDIEKFGKGYDQIGSKDAVEKLWDWLDPEDEQKVLLDYYKRTHTPAYMDTQSILSSVTLDQLINVINVEVNASKGCSRTLGASPGAPNSCTGTRTFKNSVTESQS